MANGSQPLDLPPDQALIVQIEPVREHETAEESALSLAHRQCG
jgi:hypothetical protein